MTTVTYETLGPGDGDPRAHVLPIIEGVQPGKDEPRHDIAGFGCWCGPTASTCPGCGDTVVIHRIIEA